MTLVFEMTDWQKQVVEAVIEHGSYVEAAKYLGVKPGAVSAVFFKLRTNDHKANSYHRAILEYRKRLGPKSQRYLT